MHRFVIALAVILIVAALGGKALTQTPDGQPPAEEAACNNLSGRAYGICNSYCEAQDCDAQLAPSRPSCERLRERFRAATGSDLFPCDLPPCGVATTPQCDGDCPPGQACFAGVEGGGPENGGPDANPFVITGCNCRVRCEDTTAPTCGGGCPPGLVCFGGVENGGGDFISFSGSENGTGSCSCRVPCGLATAPQCDGGCPPFSACVEFGGPENGGVDFAGPEFGGSENGGFCACATIRTFD